MRVTLEPPNISPGRGTTLEPPDFSLVLGGPLFQLFRKAHLSGASLEMLHRRVLFMPLLAWLPLLFLSVFERHALGGAIKIPFLHDIESSVRFLVALPVLIASETVVQDRISPLIRRFVEKRIVVAEDIPAFDGAVRSALRVRDSLAGELILAILVYTAGLWIWRSQVALGDPTWYALPDTKHLHLTLAGYWYALVSIPMFQFILLRWYMRLAIWFWLLWKISRLKLHLSAAHPDRAGGLGFIGKSSYAFGPILFAEGVLLSGVIASRVLYEGTALLSFKMQAAGFIGFFVLIILGPLVMFAPLLERTQRRGSREYGLLANQCVFRFEEKWLRGRVPDADDVLGSEDIQTMASMADIFTTVRQMRYVPFGTQDITYLVVIAAVPLLPLALTIFSVPELAKLLIKVLFH